MSELMTAPLEAIFEDVMRRLSLDEAWVVRLARLRRWTWEEDGEDDGGAETLEKASATAVVPQLRGVRRTRP